MRKQIKLRLTLTLVVFELDALGLIMDAIVGLTLTLVVFEFLRLFWGLFRIYSLTLTLVVFELNFTDGFSF